jgi:hypothetical protein
MQAWLWGATEAWMSFLLLTFFLFWLETMLAGGVDWGEFGIFLTALIAVPGSTFLT